MIRGPGKNNSSAREWHPDRTLFLVDISSFIFRAYYAIRGLKTSRGEPTNAVFGVAQMLMSVVSEVKPKYLVSAFDSKEPSFRKEVYKEYKAHRPPPPDDLIPQFERMEPLVEAFGIAKVRQSGIEADDLIAALCVGWLAEDKKNQVVLVTGDKDLMQLVNDRVSVWDTMKGIVYTPKEVEEKFGLPPTQIRDYLAIVGDSSDNIPGVAGIGPKGAVELLKQYETLEVVLEAAAAGKITGKKGTSLVASRADALLSQKLATLAVETKLPWKNLRDETVYPRGDRSGLDALLRELEFFSLVEKWSKNAVTSGASEGGARAAGDVGGSSSDPGVNALPSSDLEFVSVQTEKDLAILRDAILKAGECAFDLETTSLNPREAKIVGLALAVDGKRGFYIPVGHKDADAKQLRLETVFEYLKPILENPKIKKIGQNLKYDWSVLLENGINPDGLGADTMIADYVLDPAGKHNLETIAQKRLGYRVLTYEEVCGKGKDQIGFEDVPVERATRYSAEDAVIALKLWQSMKPHLEQEHLMPVLAELDFPLVRVLVDMELAGIAIDEKYLGKLSVQFGEEMAKLEKRIQSFSSKPINLQSTKQLQEFLFKELGLPAQFKTKTGYSTDASVLESLSSMHEVPKLLLEFRELAKLKNTYVDPLPLLIDKKTGRVHGSFHQTVAATGRLSSSDPNLQNIPTRTERGELIRRAFVAGKGNVLLSCDYSQIELRILASMSDDPALISAFQNDEDVHASTASEIFKTPLKSVTERERSIAKAINFGLMYGKTPFGLAQELKIPRSEAKAIIDTYFTRYSKVKRFLDLQIERARDTGFALTLLGRKRLLPEIHSKNPALRGVGERMAMNTPIQGTAADLMKRAMIDLHETLAAKKFRSRMIVQVHDELVLECPEGELDGVARMVASAMEQAVEFKVPLKVNTSVGPNWMDLKTK